MDELKHIPVSKPTTLNTIVTLGRISAQKNPELFNDIAKKFPPTLDYFWDDIHFNTGGTKKAGETIFECVMQALNSNSE